MYLHFIINVYNLYKEFAPKAIHCNNLLLSQCHIECLSTSLQVNMNLLFHTLMIIELAVFNIILLACHSIVETWLLNLA